MVIPSEEHEKLKPISQTYRNFYQMTGVNAPLKLDNIKATHASRGPKKN